MKPWYNAATIVTLMRLALLPVIAVFFIWDFFPQARLVAMILFIVAALTDFIDGWIARRFNMVTDLGKLLDPIADKLLTFLGFLLIFSSPDLLGVLFPVWFAVTVFFIATMRDFLLNMYRQLAGLRGKVMAADWSSKIKSTVQYIGISLAMFSAWYDPSATWAHISVLVLLSLATVLTLISLASHTRHFIRLDKNPPSYPK